MDELRALKQFIKVYKLIEDHNKKYAAGSVDFLLAINQFCDLTTEQKKKFTTGNFLPPYEFNNFTVRPKEVITVTPTMFPTGPASVDWKARGHVTPVKDQSYYCNSCWAFSVKKLKLFSRHLKRKNYFREMLHLNRLFQCKTIDQSQTT